MNYRGLSGVVVEFSPPTSEAAGSNLGPGASCWKVGSYLLMPGGFSALCTSFLHLESTHHNMTLAVERDVKHQII